MDHLLCEREGNLESCGVIPHMFYSKCFAALETDNTVVSWSWQERQERADVRSWRRSFAYLTGRTLVL